MAKRPGVILYLDRLNPLREVLTYDELGELLCAALDFADARVEPNFSGNDRLAIPWASMRADLIRDAARYEGKRADAASRGKYRAYKASCKEAGDSYLEYEDWRALYDANQNADAC